MDEDALRALADVQRRGRQARAHQRLTPRLTLVRALLVSAILLVSTVPDDGVRAVLLGLSVVVGAAFVLSLRVPQWAARFGIRSLSRSRRLTRREVLGSLLMGALPALVSGLVAGLLVRLEQPYALVAPVTFAVTAVAVVVGDLAWNRLVAPPREA